MRIYLFDSETGFYLGEDFSDEAMYKGSRTVPSDATTIAPPPFQRGKVPVFMAAGNQWKLRPVSAAAVGGEGAGMPEADRPNIKSGTTTRGEMTMKKVVFLFLAVSLFLAAPLHAVSYPPSAEEPTYLKDQEVMKVGARVYLFHSGTEDVKAAIKIDDVLTVYREYPPDVSGITKEAGKVRVVATLGDYYFEGKVIEGYAEPGYLAVKGTVACLITTRLKPKR